MQELVIPTEIKADQIVNGIISVICTCFGERILSIYLSGSFNRNQLTLSSDIDMSVIFRETMSDAEYDRFMQLREGLQLLSPLRLDIWAESENKIRSRPANAAQRAATCLYGEHFFPTLTPQPIEHFAMRYIHKAIHYMSVLRGRPQKNPAPLTYPRTDDEYFGYTQFADFEGIQSFTSGIRIIVNMTTACLTARLASECSIEVTTKQESLDQYQQQIGDQWSDYSLELVNLIKSELHYHFPTQAHQQEKLKSLLKQLPNFENAMLTQFEPIILENLQSNDRRRRTLALVALKNLQFQDEAILAALDTISEHHDMQLLQRVKTLYFS